MIGTLLGWWAMLLKSFAFVADACTSDTSGSLVDGRSIVFHLRIALSARIVGGRRWPRLGRREGSVHSGCSGSFVVSSSGTADGTPGIISGVVLIYRDGAGQCCGERRARREADDWEHGSCVDLTPARCRPADSRDHLHDAAPGLPRRRMSTIILRDRGCADPPQSGCDQEDHYRDDMDRVDEHDYDSRLPLPASSPPTSPPQSSVPEDEERDE